MNYKAISAEMSKFHEQYGRKPDCSVRALAVAVHGFYDYEYILNWFIEKGFREKNNAGGTKHAAHLAFLKAHKIKYIHYYREDFFKFSKYGKRNHKKDDKFDGKTIKTFQREKYQGRYFLNTYAHSVGILDGNVIDWTDNKQNRIKCITQIHLD